MELLPVSLVVKGRRCVVVGGGEVAARKAQMLRKAQAQVIVVAPQLGEALQRMHADGDVSHEHVEEDVLVFPRDRRAPFAADELLAAERPQAFLDGASLGAADRGNGACPEDLPEHRSILDERLLLG